MSRTTLIYRENGINLIRQDEKISGDNEKQVCEFLSRLDTKGIICLKEVLHALSLSLNETGIAVKEAAKDTSQAFKESIKK